MITTFKDVIWKGKPLYSCKITRDMNNEEVVAVLVKAIEDIEKEIDLSQVKLVELGIYDACKLHYKNMLTEILNALIAKDASLLLTVQSLQTQINNAKATVTTITDEKVKVSAADPTAGYLVDKIVSPQSGSIKEVGGTLSLMGFAPKGSVLIIDASRLVDFNIDGTGKDNTDVYGWAISDGKNGTRDRLGKFPRYINVLADAGNKGGANTATLKKENIASFDMAVSGSINEALVTDIAPKFYQNHIMMQDGPGGSHEVLTWTTGLPGGSKEIQIVPFSVKHSHQFTLKASHTNPTPTALSMLPEYIYEIPIQRVK